jgi:hypothetical protein
MSGDRPIQKKGTCSENSQGGKASGQDRALKACFSRGFSKNRHEISCLNRIERDMKEPELTTETKTSTEAGTDQET